MNQIFLQIYFLKIKNSVYNFEPSQYWGKYRKNTISEYRRGSFSDFTEPLLWSLVSTHVVKSQKPSPPIVDPSSMVGTSNVGLSVVDCVTLQELQ